MKVIELTQGRVAIVDDVDFDQLAKYHWHFAATRRTGGYVMRRVSVKSGECRKSISMHMQIMQPVPAGLEIDHINGNGLDNRRCNLRFCTRSQNRCNKAKQCNNTTGIKGVSRSINKTQPDSFVAEIQINKRKKYLGRFRTIEEASAAYNCAAIELHGNFARLN